MLFSRYIENFDRLHLPLSNNRYFVDITGDVYTLDNVKLESKIFDNERFVYLEWILGNRYYPIKILVAHAFKPLYLTYIWWDSINVLLLDGDKNNIHPSNLIWKFPIGLGEEKQNGFAYIPMFSRYLIDRTGFVFDTKLSRRIKGHYNSGYHAFSLMPDMGERCSLKRHRALSLAFTDYPANLDSLQVNHKNGKSTDDYLENFEWVTGSENILHAFRIGIKTPEPTPVLVRDLRTKNIQNFDSVVDCAKYFGKTPSYIGQRLREQKENVHVDGFQFKRKSDNSPWYDPVDLVKELFDRRKILLKELSSSEIIEFDTAREVSNFFDVCESVISRELNHLKIQRLYKKEDKYYLIKYKTDSEEWRTVIDPKTEYLTTVLRQKPVILRNLTTGEIKEYDSAIKCANDLEILPTTLNYRLMSKGQKIFADGTQVKYKEEPLSFYNPDSITLSILSSAPINRNIDSKLL